MSDWLDRFEAARTSTEARRALPSKPTTEHGREYFERVRATLAVDPGAAQALASRWSLLGKQSATLPWALRTKAVLERLSGNWSASVKSFDLAARAVTDPADKLVFGIGAIDSLGRIGRVEEAVRRASLLSKRLVQMGRTSEAGMAELNAANALLWHDRYKPAKAKYERAASLLDAERDKSMVAAAKLGLSTLELFGGHPKVANRIALEAEEMFLGLEQADFALLAKKNRAQALQLLGRTDEAISLLLEIRPGFSKEGLDFGRTEEFLGDAYLRLNLWREAVDAYSSALAIPSFRRSPGNLANAHLGLGASYLELGQYSAAKAHLCKALKTFTLFGNQVWKGVALTKLAKLARLEGRHLASRKLADRAVATFDHKAPALLAEAHLERAEALAALENDTTRDLRLANRYIQRSGAIQLRWRVHYICAMSTPESNALPHYRKMAAAIFESRAFAVSTSSRTSFFLGKSAALARYILHLLAKPTSPRVEEALSIVRSTRSVALLEEILTATSHRSDEIQGKLQTLRDELNWATQETNSHPTSRRSATTTRSLASLQRSWTELMVDVRSEIGQPLLLTAWPDVVLVEVPDRYLALHNGKVSVIPWSTEQLREKLSWLRFELLSPMTDRSAAAEPALELIAEFNEAFSSILTEQADPLTICPEGLLWQVPWQVLQALSNSSEAVMTVGSWSGRAQTELPRTLKAMIWFDPESSLPHVEREAQAFLTRFPQAKVCKTLAEIRTALASGSVDLLHVASHAKFNNANPLFSSLTFAGERITAGEIARSGLRTRQVVLSACETGTVSLQNRMEPEGLVRAFLARGAESVLASAWPLDDKAACDFMDSFYVELLSGRSVAEATAAARRVLRQHQPHPYFWGSFTLFGGYTS